MPSLAGVAASRAGLDLLLEIGTDVVERHVLELTGRCIEGLLGRDVEVSTRLEPEQRAGVVALPVSRGDRVVSFLRERAVDVWSDPAHTLLRIDPHIFNHLSDLERLFVGLDEFRRTFGAEALQVRESRPITG